MLRLISTNLWDPFLYFFVVIYDFILIFLLFFIPQGDVLGCGAFGAVHKGFWHIRDTDSKPPNDVKIPVAIKLLHDCDGANSSNAILEEAKIMASIEHPNLLKLLAISMTSRLMLVTQLMPLGKQFYFDWQFLKKYNEFIR